jgi:PAS domain-containing protein
MDAILEAQTDVVMLVRPSGEITHANSAGRRLLGLHAEHEAQTSSTSAPPVTEWPAEFVFHDETGHLLSPEKLPTSRVLRGVEKC